MSARTGRWVIAAVLVAWAASTVAVGLWLRSKDVVNRLHRGDPTLTGLLFPLAVAEIALIVFGVVDMIRQPEWAWRFAGRSKWRWIAALVVGLLVSGTYWVALAYVLVVRTRLHTSKDEAISRSAARHQPLPGFRRPDDDPSYEEALARLDALADSKRRQHHE